MVSISMDFGLISKRFDVNDMADKIIFLIRNKQAAKNITRQAVGTAIPLYGNIAMGFLGAGLFALDVIKLIQTYNEEEEE